MLMVEDVSPLPGFSEPFPDLIAHITMLVGRVAQSRNLKSPHRDVTKLLSRMQSDMKDGGRSPMSYICP